MKFAEDPKEDIIDSDKDKTDDKDKTNTTEKPKGKGKNKKKETASGSASSSQQFLPVDLPPMVDSLETIMSRCSF